MAQAAKVSVARAGDTQPASVGVWNDQPRQEHTRRHAERDICGDIVFEPRGQPEPEPGPTEVVDAASAEVLNDLVQCQQDEQKGGRVVCQLRARLPEHQHEDCRQTERRITRRSDSTHQDKENNGWRPRESRTRQSLARATHGRRARTVPRRRRTGRARTSPRNRDRARRRPVSRDRRRWPFPTANPRMSRLRRRRPPRERARRGSACRRSWIREPTRTLRRQISPLARSTRIAPNDVVAVARGAKRHPGSDAARLLAKMGSGSIGLRGLRSCVARYCSFIAGSG